MKYVHTNIVARDWKKLAAFYQAVFGCTVKPPERDLSGDWLDQATGLRQAALKGVHLLLPGHGEAGPTLEIFSYQEMVKRDPIAANYTGFNHIAFAVEEVDKVYALALTQGAKELGRVTERVIPEVGTVKFVYFRDPEGNIIEIQSWR